MCRVWCASANGLRWRSAGEITCGGWIAPDVGATAVGLCSKIRFGSGLQTRESASFASTACKIAHDNVSADLSRPPI
jgi:hypothetical protein